MRERVLFIAVMVLLAIPASADDVEQVIGRPAGPAVRGVELDHRAAQVAALLRCPTCQGLSVLDSHAPMAMNMKTQVRNLLERGYDRDQILEYFGHSYGDFVLLDPPKKGINWAVWLAPIAAFLAGIVLIYSMTSRKKNVVTVPGVPAQDLAPYLARVRELVDGENRDSRGRDL